MVWLKGGGSVKKITTQEAFQFQYGLIKRIIKHSPFRDKEEISIPIWFD